MRCNSFIAPNLRSRVSVSLFKTVISDPTSVASFAVSLKIPLIDSLKESAADLAFSADLLTPNNLSPKTIAKEDTILKANPNPPAPPSSLPSAFKAPPVLPDVAFNRWNDSNN